MDPVGSSTIPALPDGRPAARRSQPCVVWKRQGWTRANFCGLRLRVKPKPAHPAHPANPDSDNFSGEKTPGPCVLLRRNAGVY